MGQYFNQYHDLSVICMRIGWTQWTHDNQPGSHMAMGRWGQEMWLSDRDFLNGMTCAIKVENIGFAALNLMSDNIDMRWDIEETKKAIGYTPKDSHKAQLTLMIKLRALIKKYVTFSLPRAFDKWFPEW
jgi:hypothetical protein